MLLVHIITQKAIHVHLYSTSIRLRLRSIATTTLKMDDEIDIEEHDILEHPQVKAVFPDLSKIQIQVHATGDSFLYGTSEHAEETGNLLEERQDYTGYDVDGITDDSSKAHEFKDTNFEADVSEAFSELEELEDDLSVRKDVLEEALVISDGECTDDALPAIKEPTNSNVDNSLDLINKDNVDVQETEDEFFDKAQHDAVSKLIDETEEGMEIEAVATLNKNRSLGECNILVDNVYEISDDEPQNQEPEDNRDVFIEKAPNNNELIEEMLNNGDGFIEDTLNTGVDLLEEALENDDGLIEDAPKTCDEFIDDGLAISNVELESDDIDAKMPEQNIDEIDLKHSEDALDEEEYKPIRIKEEIEFESESMTGFDETLPEETFNNDDLPPEDIYHFNNKIILGSKPSRPQGNLIMHPNSYLVVLLEDWNVHLSRSQSFCEDCQTLFTTPNALDSHRMTAHSLLAPITNRAVKSTAKSSVNVARKSTTKVKHIANSNKELTDPTYCNHCNVTFKDHTTLIKHLYKLLPVKQYACSICDATFKNQNDLVNHNTVHVKVEPRKILKAKTSDNSILRKMLNNEMKPMTSKAIKRSHPVEQTPSKAVKQPVKINREVSKELWVSRFKCLVCKQVLNSYPIARKHRLKHPQSTAPKKMFERLPPKTVNPHNSKGKLKYEDDNKTKVNADVKPFDKQPFELIPKSALFQCPKCSLHFLTCVAASSHVTGNRCNDKMSWSCPICKKKFRKIDEECHRMQHELCTKLTIYKFTKTTYERTLCRCLKCGVHFDYIPLKAHIAKCGKIPNVKCKRCNILLSKYKILEHNKKHDIMKFKPKDFIRVDYVVLKDKNSSKTSKTKKSAVKTANRKALLGKNIKVEPTAREPEQDQSQIVNKLEFEQDKVKLYYCRHCKCFLSRRAKSHMTKQCLLGKYKLTVNCNLCGIQVFLKYRRSHDRLHEENNFTLKDIEFVDVATLKSITPPIPKYPSCSKCQIHFLDRKTIDNHICGEDYENCEVCGDKFENSALDLHLPFHNLLAAKRKPRSAIQPKIIPELMMKYESINAIWNILFICGKCELVTDLYNKAVEHSQVHLKKDNAQPNTIKCYICNLKFDESCWSKHSELHSRMPINSKDFKILKYTPRNLLDESWFQMFESLPEQEIRQIIDRSVFGSERSLKMRLVKDGLPEFTLYCCSICQVSYDNNDILNHVKDKCRGPKHVCRECDVAFDSASSLNFHALLHKKGIKMEEFRIVNFAKDSKTTSKNASNDRKTVKVKKEKKKAGSSSQKPDLEVKKKAVERGSKYVLYKCAVCSGCVQLKNSQSVHICAPVNRLSYCDVCDQNFSFRQMGAHRRKHRMQPDFLAKNTRVVSFEPIPEDEDKATTNISRTKPKAAIKRSSKNSLASSISLETDLHSETEPTSSKRRASVESFESLVNLITSNNVTKPKKRKSLSAKRSESLLSASTESSDTEDKRTAKLFKCDCGLHYTSLKSIEKHIKTCDDDNEISKENCSKCGLLFPTDVLVTHLCKHHSKNTKLTVKEIHKIETVTSTQKDEPKTPEVKTHVKLYKCSECNVYFLNQNSCYKHTSKHEPLDPKQYIECKMCCLQFRILSLHIHMKKHHASEFNLERVLVEEYNPSVGKQAPRIDIYFASERCQNVQVSSSND